MQISRTPLSPGIALLAVVARHAWNCMVRSLPGLLRALAGLLSASVSVIAAATISPLVPTHRLLHVASHSRRDPFPLTGAFWATSPPPLIETIPRLSPRFLSTVGHSDFSHDIPGDFAGSLLIRPGTRPVEQDRTRSPGVTRAPSPPCRPHTPCCVQRPKYFLRPYSAGSVAAGLGRPVSPLSATARRFAANPSDPTSRWAPCPAQASAETAAPSPLSASRPPAPSEALPPPLATDPAWDGPAGLKPARNTRRPARTIGGSDFPDDVRLPQVHCLSENRTRP